MSNELKLNTPLTTEEIDFRVQSITKNGYATILAYKDARVDMNRLDAVFGVGFWQRKHELINGKEFCSVGVWNKELQQWCWVQDCGTQSNTEKEKGESSDAFKRACFNLGIGRELYDYPTIRVKLKPNEFTIVGDKAKQTYDLNLSKWVWLSVFDENKKLKLLTAVDEKGETRFTYGTPKSKQTTPNIKLLTTNSKAWQQIVTRVSDGEIIKKSDLLKHYDLSEVQNELENLNIF